MDRRRAILSMVLLGGTAVATFSGYEFYLISKSPDLAYLDQQKALIADLTEVIIPRTDTPGAKDVLAHETVIALLKNSSDKKTQNNFIEGLKALKGYAAEKYGNEFSALSVAQQNEIALIFYKKSHTFSGLAAKAKNKVMGKPFFDILKQYTSIAFCTSKGGATQALAYNYIPGTYSGCLPLTPHQRSWATK